MKGYLQLFHSVIYRLLKSENTTEPRETTHCAAIFFVPGGAATIINVSTQVTENIALMKSISPEPINHEVVNNV